MMLPQCVGPFLLKLCGRGSVGGVLFQGIVVDDKVQTIAVQVGQALAYGGVVPSKLDHAMKDFLQILLRMKNQFLIFPRVKEIFQRRTAKTKGKILNISFKYQNLKCETDKTDFGREWVSSE